MELKLLELLLQEYDKLINEELITNQNQTKKDFNSGRPQHYSTSRKCVYIRIYWYGSFHQTYQRLIIIAVNFQLIK